MAGNVFKGLTIQFEGEDKNLISTIRTINKEANSATKGLKQIDKALAFNPNNAALMTRQIELMEQRIVSTAKELQTYKQLQEDALSGKTKLNTEQWTELQAKIAMAEGKLAKYKQELAQAYIKQDVMNSALGKTGTALSEWGTKWENAGQKVSSVGSTLTKTVTGPLAAIGAASVVAAVKIDDSLTSVRKTVDGTEEQYQQLKQAAIEFSKTNAVSADQILDIQSLGAQLGFAIDELQLFGEVVSGLDIATNMDAETAATEMAQFANITKMAHTDIENYGSAIVGLGNNMATTESDISSMAMRLAAAGTQVGMSQADILGLAAALSSMGVEAEAGGTAVSTIMANIDKAVATNSDTVADWTKAAGMSAQEFANAWRSDPVQALGAVLSGMESAVDEGGNMSLILDELGIKSIRQTDVMKRLAGNSQLVANAVGLANEEWTKNTALANEVANRNDSLSAKFEMIKNKGIALAEAFGGPLADAILDVIDAAEPLVQAISDGAKAFSEMDKGQQQTILAAVALVAALGPILTVLGKIPTGAKNVGSALTTMATFFSKVGGAGKQAEAALAGTATASTNTATALDKTTKASKLTYTALGALKTLGIAAAIGLVVTAFTALINVLNDNLQAANNYKTATTGLKDAVSTVPSAMDAAKGSIKATGDTASESVQSIKDLTESHADLVRSIRDTNTEASNNIGMIDTYGNTIEALAGRADLSSVQVAQLKNAVENVNDACGTAYEVTQDASGAYQLMADGAIVAKDAINQLIEMKKLEIQLDAQQSNWEEVYKTQAESAKTLADAKYNLTTAEQNYQKIIEQGGQLTLDQQADLERLNDEYQRALDLYNGDTEALKAYEDQMTLTQMAMDENASAQTRWLASNGQLQAALVQSGQSVTTLAQQLTDMGVSTETLNSLTTDQLAQLGSTYDGTFGSIAGLIEGYNTNLMTALETANNFFGSNSEGIVAWAMQQGISIDEAIAKLQEYGFSAEQMSTMSQEQLQILVESYSGSMDEIIAKCSEAGIAVPEQVVQMMTDSTAAIEDGQPAFAGALEGTVVDTTRGKFEVAKDEAGNLVYKMMDTAASNIENKQGDIESAERAAIQSTTNDVLNDTTSDASSGGSDIGGELASGVDNEASTVQSSAEATIQEPVNDVIDQTAQDAQQGGQETGQSFSDGISAKQGDVQSASNWLGDTAVSTLNSFSNSAYTAGANIGQSFANGLSSKIAAVSNASASLKNAATINVQADLSRPVAPVPVNYIALGNSEPASIATYGTSIGSQFNKLAKAAVSELQSRTSSASKQVRLSIDSKAQLTRDEVYTAFMEALEDSMPSDIGVYIDGQQLSNATAKFTSVALGRLSKRR